MKGIKYLLALAICSAIGLSGCLKDFEKAANVSAIKLNGNYGLPLAESDMSIANILASRAPVQNLFPVPAPNGLYTFLYFKTFFSKQAQEYVSLPDFNTSTSVSGQGSSTPANITVNFNAALAPGNSRELTQVNLKSGNLRISLNSTFKQSFFIKLRFPNSTAGIGGIVETPEYLIAASSGTPVSLVQNLDLAGANLPTNAPPGFNSLACQAVIRINGASTAITTLDNISVGLIFSTLAYSELKGYLGNISFAQNDDDTVRIKLFDDNIEDGSIIFNDPSAELEPFNSFGIPISLTMTNLRTLPKNKPQVVMSGTGANLFTNVNVLPATTTEPFKITPAIIINKSTSNIVAMMEPAPDNFAYRLSLATNPGAPSATNRNQFLKDTSRIRMRALIRLPADGRVLRYRFKDTTAIKFPDSDQDLPYIESVEFKLVVKNGFPIDADLQGLFINQAGVIIDSIAISPAGTSVADQRASRLIAEAPNVDATGRVDLATVKTTTKTYLLDKTRYEKITKNAKKLVFRANLNTSNAAQGTNVKIYPDYRFKVQLGMKIKTNGVVKLD